MPKKLVDQLDPNICKRAKEKGTERRKDPLRCLSFVTMHAKTESLTRETPFIGVNYWLFSTMQAVPWPPPMHSVAKPYFAFFSLRP